MTSLQKLGLAVFSVLFVFAVIFSYLINSQFIKMPEKPWHMQPFTDADVLTAEYEDKYELLDGRPLLSKFAGSTWTTVAILVDAWSVPFDEHLLVEDFSVFKGLKYKKFLHHRLANRTRHAEFAELRHNGGGLYLFGGDSLEYGRNLYIDSLGYSQHRFCQKCADSVILGKLDSLLPLPSLFAPGEAKVIALTTQNSRDGDRAKLHATLRGIAAVARKHPKVRFIIQGTHRPILGDPKIRLESFTHWVPAVVIN